MTQEYDDTLVDLLNVVIDHYIHKGEPIGSKFLHSLETIDYAPSTLRKYLNILEKSWLVYQPYKSSWRIPTIQWFETYLDQELAREGQSDIDLSQLWIDQARSNLRHVIEQLGNVVDGVMVGFLQNDEYYFLWINNLLREDLLHEYETTRYIIDFIEQREVVPYLATKMMQRNRVYYTFVQDDEKVISCLYAKISLNEYDAIVSILWPTRVNYKKNVSLLKHLIHMMT